MKKLSFLFAAIIAVLGFSSCSQDTEPVYHAPSTFVLNDPVFANQYYQLAEGGTFYLYCSQPDYGYSAITNYSCEVSLTPDFEKFETILSTGSGTSAAMNYKDADLALAMCKLLDVEEPEQVPAYAMPVYFRAVAELSNVESSRIVSNVVKMNAVQPYFAVPQPDIIWLIGKCSGWVEPAEANAEKLAGWTLSEGPGDEIGSKIYKGTFEIAAGDAMFRFYTALTGWDGGASIGYQEADEATDVEFVGNTYSGKLVKGKGSFNFASWPGGTMDIVVNLNDDAMTIVIDAHPAE